MSASAAMRKLVERLYGALSAAFGPRHWWPAETDEEVVIGAVLTQNTAWSNVEKALGNLRRAGLLGLREIHAAGEAQLAQLIRPSGYFNLKARRLKAVAAFFADRMDGSLASLRSENPETLRAALLSVYGVGPETADSILLYALDMPVFVIDAYTRRVMARHGCCVPDAPYEALRRLFEAHLPRDRALFNEYHALFVAVGHRYCKPTPRCAECPLMRRRLYATAGAWEEMNRAIHKAQAE
ncbi:MAG: Endonuclease III [candidate division BRC1 bacterium ADurb.BinA364]|nr:MAG: Endonuclease III [candidate division BRC1 bacterium ADurb.BinA364]